MKPNYHPMDETLTLLDTEPAGQPLSPDQSDRTAPGEAPVIPPRDLASWGKNYEDEWWAGAARRLLAKHRDGPISPADIASMPEDPSNHSLPTEEADIRPRVWNNPY